MRISYPGPAGTYSEIAALTYATTGDTFVSQPTLPAGRELLPNKDCLMWL
jgi:prephenate dehydratase